MPGKASLLALGLVLTFPLIYFYLCGLEGPGGIQRTRERKTPGCVCSLPMCHWQKWSQGWRVTWPPISSHPPSSFVASGKQWDQFPALKISGLPCCPGCRNLRTQSCFSFTLWALTGTTPIGSPEAPLDFPVGCTIGTRETAKPMEHEYVS